MKLKIKAHSTEDKITIQNLFFSINAKWAGSSESTMKPREKCGDLFFLNGQVITHSYTEFCDFDFFEKHEFKEVSIAELTALVKPKEYLDNDCVSNFRFSITNQPKPGWIAIPPEAVIAYQHRNDAKVYFEIVTDLSTLGFYTPPKVIWRRENVNTYLNDKNILVETSTPKPNWILITDEVHTVTKCRLGGSILLWRDDLSGKGETCASNNHKLLNWFKGQHATPESFCNAPVYSANAKKDIIWKRTNNKTNSIFYVEMLEKYINGEVIEFQALTEKWHTLKPNQLNYFNDKRMKLRVKTKTMIVNGRTIIKSITDKPKIGEMFFVPAITSQLQYSQMFWGDTISDNYMLSVNIIHLSKENAIEHTKAILLNPIAIVKE